MKVLEASFTDHRNYVSAVDDYREWLKGAEQSLAEAVCDQGSQSEMEQNLKKLNVSQFQYILHIKRLR